MSLQAFLEKSLDDKSRLRTDSQSRATDVISPARQSNKGPEVKTDLEKNVLSFFERLPKKPYCTNDPKSGLLIRKKETALRYHLLQINSPKEIHTLVFDVDTEFGGFAWEAAGLPPPSFSAINPSNGHAHLFYWLKTPVLRSERSRSKPLQYLKAIERSFKEKMGADSGYVGLLAKNPFSNRWNEGPFDTKKTYDLDELAEYADLKKNMVLVSKTERNNGAVSDLQNFKGVVQIGERNEILFNEIRFYSYELIKKGLVSTPEDLNKLLKIKASEIVSKFEKTLPESEVRATIKSVAHWVCSTYLKGLRNGTNTGKNLDKESECRTVPAWFSEKQRQRALKSAEVRQAKMKTKMEEVFALRKQNKSINQISKETGYSYESVRRWCLEIKKLEPETEKFSPKQEEKILEEDHVSLFGKLIQVKKWNISDPDYWTKTVTQKWTGILKTDPIFLSKFLTPKEASAEGVLSLDKGTKIILLEDYRFEKNGLLLYPEKILKGLPQKTMIDIYLPNVTFRIEEAQETSQSGFLNDKFQNLPYQYSSFFMNVCQKVGNFEFSTGVKEFKNGTFYKEDLPVFVSFLRGLSWTKESVDPKKQNPSPVFKTIVSYLFSSTQNLFIKTWKNRFSYPDFFKGTDSKSTESVLCDGVGFPIASFCLATGRLPEDPSRLKNMNSF